MCATFYWIICHQSNVTLIHIMYVQLIDATMYIIDKNTLSGIICMMTAGDNEREYCHFE